MHSKMLSMKGEYEVAFRRVGSGWECDAILFGELVDPR